MIPFKINFTFLISILFIFIVMTCILVFSIPYFSDQINTQHLHSLFCPPNLHHLFGTDELGRDIFLRVFYGGFISLFIGFSSNFISAFVGIFLGLIACIKGGFFKSFIMTFMDVLLCIPSLAFCALMIIAFSKNLSTLIFSMGIWYIPVFTKLIYYQAFPYTQLDFIRNAKMQGASSFYMIKNHLLPLCLPIIKTQFVTGIAGAILGIAALSFIGFGIDPPTPEWGSMIVESQNYLNHSFWMIFFPALFIVITVFCLDYLSIHLYKKDFLDDYNSK